MVDLKQITLPNNTAGQLIYDVFHSLAKKMWSTGKETTGNYALANFPDCKLVKNEYSNRTFRRTIRIPNGEYIEVVYDFMTQTTIATELPHYQATLVDGKEVV